LPAGSPTFRRERETPGVLATFVSAPVLMRFSVPAVLVFSVWLAAAPAHADHPLPGHSLNGESFDEGPRQMAVLMGGTGAVHFPVTTKSSQAQRFFDQAVGQLHGFWYFESERSFRTVAALDPGCAMAYWGMAMSNVNNAKRAKEFLKKAVELKPKAGKKDQLWITVLENYYRDDKREKKQRELDYIRDLENIVQEHPKDVEAKAFLAWRIWLARDDAPISSKQAVDALLDQIFAQEPMHPAHHYRIHLWDDSKPSRALDSAAKCGQTSPGIAHMWHMPGHTYTKLRRFDDAAWQQEAATRVDHRHMIEDLVLPDQIHNYAHNEEWLTRTFNELGRATDAIGLAKSLVEIPRHPAWNTLDKAASSASYGRTRLTETLLKWELWDQIIALAGGPLLAPVAQPAHEATRLRALGIAHFNLNQPKELDAGIAALESLEKQETEKTKQQVKDASKKPSEPAAKKAEPAAAKSEPKPEIRKAEPVKPGKATVVAAAPAATQQQPAAAAKPDANKKAAPAKAIENALAELRLLRAILKKDHAAARKVMENTPGDIPKERLARYYLRIDDKTKAWELTKNFNQDLAGLAAKTEVLMCCGKDAEAKTAFEAARKAAFSMDRDLPIATRLAALALRFNISGDWRGPAPKRTDNGVRPALESLGPVHWQPPPGRAWSALDANGKTVSDKDYRGRNVVLCLYLGHECGHCMQQLNAVAGVADQLKAADIAVAAISIEKPGDVAKANALSKTGKEFPFPLLSDEKLRVFKTWRAYDDFEKMPLHALVLIDATNHVRWIDIGFEPFTDAQFLVDECRRLLKLPAATSPVAAVPANGAGTKK